MNLRTRQPVAGGRALEVVMRDVLGGLEELATMAGYEAAPGVFEILAIEPPRRESKSERAKERKNRPSPYPVSLPQPIPLGRGA